MDACLSLHPRSKVTGWGSTLTDIQNAMTSGLMPIRGIWNQPAGVRRMDTSYCCLKVTRIPPINMKFKVEFLFFIFLTKLGHNSADWACRVVGCKDGEFNWSTYVKNCRGQLAPKHLFKSLNTVSVKHIWSCQMVLWFSGFYWLRVGKLAKCILSFCLFVFSPWLHPGLELGWNWRRLTGRILLWSV